MINQCKGQSQIKPKPLKIEKEQNDPKIIGNCLNYTCYKQVLTHTNNMCLYSLCMRFIDIYHKDNAACKITCPSQVSSCL